MNAEDTPVSVDQVRLKEFDITCAWHDAAGNMAKDDMHYYYMGL